MANSKLGLPFEYKKWPEYFDAMNVSDTTEAKNGVIEKLLAEHKVETVLDLTCGTGSQVFFLAKYGYKVTGADFSPALLDIAREKARHEKLDLQFIDGDMRTLKVGTFDAVITIFNAVGHLTKPGFEKTMRNIHRNLKEGGIYLFDIFNLEAMTDNAVADLAMDEVKKVDSTLIHHAQYSTIDRKNGRLTSYDHYIIQKGFDIPKTFKTKFTLQIYTAKELQEMLARNGFEVLGHYGMEGEKFLKDATMNILTVAMKR